MQKPTFAMIKLQFQRNIVPTHDNPLTTSEILKRLRDLLGELTSLSQDTIDRDSVLPVARSLVNNNLLHHKDKGIRSYTLCCIVELLRLCAPDAPFTLSQLEDIFQVILKILSGLMNQESTYYPQIYEILESLSNVKSAVLIVDLPNAEEFLVNIFRLFFDLARKGTTKNVEFYMLDIINQLINEINTIPAAALNILFAQLISGKGVRQTIGSSDSTNHGPAFQLARNIFHDSADRLQRYVCQYFSDIIFDSRDSLSDSMTTPEFIFSHNLVLQLWKYAPTTLLNIIPQFENELQAEQTSVRLVAIETVGLMLQDNAIWSDYPRVWSAFCGRLNDKSVACRIKCIEVASNVLQNSLATSEIIENVVQMFQSKLADTDEKVRVATLKTIEQLTFETFKMQFSVQALKLMGDRLRDRKLNVRLQAIRTLSQIYNRAYQDLIDGVEYSIQMFSWIPSSLLEVFYVNDETTNAAVEICMAELVLQYLSSDTQTRLNRLFLSIKYFSEKAMRVFILLLQRQVKYSELLNYYIECCKNYNGGVMDNDEESITNKLKKVIDIISSKSSNPTLTEATFRKFAELNDRQSYKMLLQTFSIKSEYQVVLKSIKYLFKRVSETLSTASLECFRIFVYRSALFAFNKSNVHEIIQLLNEPVKYHNFLKPSEALLQHLPLIHPNIYGEVVIEVENIIVSSGIESDPKVIKALSQFSKRKKNFSTQTTTAEILRKLCLHGTQEQAKQAATIIAITETKEFKLDMITNIVENLEYNGGLPVRLMTLGQLFLYTLEEVEKVADQVTEFLVKKVIQRFPEKYDDTHNDEEWCTYEKLDNLTMCKVLAIRVLVNRLRAAAGGTEALNIGAPIIKLLKVLLMADGELSPFKNTPKISRAYLRLTASKYFLKLCSIPFYAEHIDFSSYVQISLLCQDENFDVRNLFLTKLQKQLQLKKLPISYYPLLFLTAVDPEEEIKTKASIWIRSQVAFFQKTHDFTMEYVATYLIHLLSHHPDISSIESENSLDFIAYIRFYVDTVVNSENVPIVFHLMQRIKQSYDVIEDGNNYIYVLSDMAQKILQVKSQNFGWSLTTYPKQIKLPYEILRPIPSIDEKKRIFNKIFITPKMESQIEHAIRTPVSSFAKQTTNKHANLKQKKTHSSKSDKKSSRRRKNEKKRKLNEQNPNIRNVPERSSSRFQGIRINYSEAPSSSEEISEEEEEISEEDFDEIEDL